MIGGDGRLAFDLVNVAAKLRGQTLKNRDRVRLVANLSAGAERQDQQHGCDGHHDGKAAMTTTSSTSVCPRWYCFMASCTSRRRAGRGVRPREFADARKRQLMTRGRRAFRFLGVYLDSPLRQGAGHAGQSIFVAALPGQVIPGHGGQLLKRVGRFLRGSQFRELFLAWPLTAAKKPRQSVVSARPRAWPRQVPIK